MGFPKKISQFPINPDLTGQDLLVTVNEFDVTSRINLQQLRDFVIDGKDNTFVTGGTVTEEAELILFRNDGLSFTIDLNPALSNTITGAENIPGGEGLIYSGKTNNELLLRSISGGENVIVETLGNIIQIGVEIPPDTNTFVTGFTYNGNINRFTITDNQNNSYDATINFTQNLNVKRNLNISGTTGDTPEITFETSSTTLSKIESQSFGGASSGNLEFYTYPNAISGLVKRMTIGTNGRVGIGRMGNNDITNTLHVSGSTRITDSLFLENVGPNAEPIIANLVLNSEGKVVSGTTTDNNTFITGTTLNSTIYTINQNDGTSFSTDFDSIVSGKLDTDIFNTYTANTTDNVVTGATLVGTTLELERNNGLSDVTVDLSPLSGISENTFVTGFTYNDDNTLTISRNDGVDLSASINTMTGLTVNGNLLLPDGGVGGPYIGLGDAEDLKIFHNGNHSIIRETGTGSLYLQSDDSVILSKDSGTELMVRGIADGSVELYYDNVKKLETSIDGVVLSGDLITGDNRLTYAPTSAGIVSFLDFTVTQFGQNNNTVLSSVKSINLFLDSNGGDSGQAFRIYNNASPDSPPLENTYIFKVDESGDVLIKGNLSLLQTPTLNNSGTEILVRNTSTGQIDYRDVTTLSGSPTDTFVTGLTYNSTSNTVTLTQNESGPTQSVVIDSFSGVTLNGTTNINGNTVVDGDVLITKNVVILGTATTINSSTFSVDDNIITLNANATGSTVPLPIDSGIDILRNSGDTAVLLWEELNGYWAAGLSGATEPLIVNGNNLGGGTNVFKQRNENVLDFNTLSGGTNVTLTAVGDIVRFDVPDNTNTFITGATLNGNTLEIERNDGVDVPVDLTSLISGKLDISTFDSYTANTLDIYVTGGTLNSNTLELGRTDGDTVSIDLSSINFTGNTSGDCITNLWVSNINGCNQVTIGTELVVDDFITGKTTTLFGENNSGGGTRAGLTPTLTIFDNPGTGGGSQNYAGPNLRFSDNGNIGDIFYRYNGGGNLLSNSFNFISDGGFNFIAEGDNGSPSLSDGPYFRVTKGQSSLQIYDDTTRPRTDVKITNSNGGDAYSRLGVGAQNDYWYIEADDVDTPMHIGYDDNGVDTNVFTFEKSEGLLEGSLEITSGLTANTITVRDIYSTGDTQTPITFHGSLSQSNCTAIGDNSVAFGFDTTANGADTFAIGYNTQASGSESFAGGVGTEVSGAISFGFGLNHIVSGNKSFVIGGEGITGSTDETVYVPNLNIDSTPTVNNSGTEILVRNTTTGNVEYRESNTLGSITGATNVTTTGLFKQINGKDLEFKGIQSSGGTVTITTDANTVNLESTSSGGNTVNSATKVFNWFMTIT